MEPKTEIVFYEVSPINIASLFIELHIYFITSRPSFFITKLLLIYGFKS